MWHQPQTFLVSRLLIRLGTIFHPYPFTKHQVVSLKKVSKACFFNVTPSVPFHLWSFKFSHWNFIPHLCRCRCTDFSGKNTAMGQRISAHYPSIQVYQLYLAKADLLERNPVLTWRLRDGESSMSVSILFQWLIVLTVYKRCVLLLIWIFLALASSHWFLLHLSLLD